jgi:hypothetical protein
VTDDETPLRCKYALIIAAFRDLGELVKKQQASISELEAAWQQEHTKRADLIVDLQRMTNRAEQAEAALAERDARKCETCRDWVWSSNPRLHYCDDDVVIGASSESPFSSPADFACNRWAARAEEGRE